MLVRYSTPTREQVIDVAREAVSVFAKCGLEACLVGGAACALYGATRTPSVRYTLAMWWCQLIMGSDRTSML